MAKKNNKYSEDRIKLKISKNKSKELEDYLCHCLEKYIEPRIKFAEPYQRGDDTITVVCDDFEIGDLLPEEENLYYLNSKNARRAYLEIYEPEEEGDEIECVAVMVVKSSITEEDMKNAGKNKTLVYVAAIALLLTTGIVSLIRGQVVDGIFFLVMSPVVFYIAFVKGKGKNEDFLPRAKRKQK